MRYEVKMKSFTTIDGSMGEGGGQVFRTSLALSLTTGKPFRISNIRAKRKKGGLLRQHLTALNAAAAVGQAKVRGAVMGSSEVTFEPGEIKPGTFQFSIGTAGSTSLVLQTVLPALMTASAPSHLVLEGGTHNPYAPPFDFLEKAFTPLLRKMGPEVTCCLHMPGFHPAGGGRFTVSVKPVPKLKELHLPKRGELKHCGCRALVAQLGKHIGDREVKVICEEMGWSKDSSEVVLYRRSQGPGNVVIIEVESENVTEVITGFGMRGVMAEQVALGAVEEVKRYLDAGVPVGVHLADQILLPMALAGEGSFRTLSPSLHTRTNIQVIQAFLDVTIECVPKAADDWEIRVESKKELSKGGKP